MMMMTGAQPTFGVIPLPQGAVAGQSVPIWAGMMGMVDAILSVPERIIPVVEMDYQGGPTEASGFKVNVMTGAPLNTGNWTTLANSTFAPAPYTNIAQTATLNIKKYMASLKASATADQFQLQSNGSALVTGPVAEKMLPTLRQDWKRMNTMGLFGRKQGAIGIVETPSASTVTLTVDGSILEAFPTLSGAAQTYEGEVYDAGGELCFVSAGGTVRGTLRQRSYNPYTRTVTLSGTAASIGIEAGDLIYYRNPIVGGVNVRPYTLRDLADATTFPELFGLNASTNPKWLPQNRTSSGTWNQIRAYEMFNQIPQQNPGICESLEVFSHPDTKAACAAAVGAKVGYMGTSMQGVSGFNMNLPDTEGLTKVGDTPINWTGFSYMARGEVWGMGNVIPKEMAGIPIKADVKEFPNIPAMRLSFPNLSGLMPVPLIQGQGAEWYRLPGTLFNEVDAIAYHQYATIGESRRFLLLQTGWDTLNSFSN